MTEAPLIYAVDDMPDMTELYSMALEAAGCLVKAFNDRGEALAALKTDRTKPALLITDYLNGSAPVDSFIHDCRLIHPALRILLASGFSPEDERLTRLKPDCILGKPFTLEELRQGVRMALMGEDYQISGARLRVAARADQPGQLK